MTTALAEELAAESPAFAADARIADRCRSSTSALRRPSLGRSRGSRLGHQAEACLGGELTTLRADAGDCSAGFRTTVSPNARAGGVFHVSSIRGKFHGAMAAIPASWFVAPVDVVISVGRDRLVLDVARVVSEEPEVVCSSWYVLAACLGDGFAYVCRVEPCQVVGVTIDQISQGVRCRPRSSGDIRGHGPSSNAQGAAVTARSTSTVSASATGAHGVAADRVDIGDHASIDGLDGLVVDEMCDQFDAISLLVCKQCAARHVLRGLELGGSRLGWNRRSTHRPPQCISDGSQQGPFSGRRLFLRPGAPGSTASLLYRLACAAPTPSASSWLMGNVRPGMP